MPQSVSLSCSSIAISTFSPLLPTSSYRSPFAVAQTPYKRQQHLRRPLALRRLSTKSIFREALTPAGIVRIQEEVVTEAQAIDTLFVPDPARAHALDDLGYLGRMARVPSVFEAYHNTMNVPEYRGCVRKRAGCRRIFNRRGAGRAELRALEQPEQLASKSEPVFDGPKPPPFQANPLKLPVPIAQHPVHRPNVPLRDPGAAPPHRLRRDHAVRPPKMKMSVNEHVGLWHEARHAPGESARPKDIFRQSNGADDVTEAELIDRSHGRAVGIKKVLGADNVSTVLLISPGAKRGLTKAVAMQDTHALAAGALPIVDPSIWIERRSLHCRVVVPLDIDNRPPFGAPHPHQVCEPRDELCLDASRQAPVRVNDIAVKDDELGVVDRFGQPLKELLVLARAGRPSQMDVGQQEGPPYAHGQSVPKRVTRVNRTARAAGDQRRALGADRLTKLASTVIDCRSLSRTIADYPSLLAEWHPTHNGSLTPERVSAGTQRMVWWRCPRGPDHEWQALAGNRTRGAGCPFCAHLRVSIKTALSTVRPDIAQEWHPTRNGDLLPSHVVAGSNRNVVWQCRRSPLHQWTARIADRTGRGSGCPYCAGKLVCADNNLAVRAPAVAAMWHPTKNGSLTPSDVTPGSGRRVWWLCPKGEDHEWIGLVNDRTKYGCPVCAGRKATKSTSLAARYPAIAAEWHPKKNGPLGPHDVVSGSNRRVVWRCSKNRAHEWSATIVHRTSGTGCPVCAGMAVGSRPKRENSLAAEAPALVKEWHPTKNGELRPDEILAGSGKKVWWKCPSGPDHEWQVTPARRVRRGYGCPFCSGRLVSMTTSLAAVYPGRATLWHPTRNGSLTPRDVTVGSNRLVWWRCADKPRHVWQSSVQHLSGCPYCSHKRTLPEESLARRASAVARQWHPTKNAPLTPKDVVPGSNRRAWWVCPKGPDHVWQTIIRERAVAGTGCPFCSGRRISMTNALATLFPEIAAQWHPTKNTPLTPRDVRAKEHRCVSWRCEEGPDHEWDSPVWNRTQLGSGCPFCSNRRVSVTNCFAAKHPHTALYWHPTRNAPLTPWQVFSSSEKRVWWRCDQGHEWQARVMHRVKKRGGCPICHGLSRGRAFMRRKIREVVRLQSDGRDRNRRGG